MNIHAMLKYLEPGGTHYIAFEVGKLGRVDRFVLKVSAPNAEPIMAFSTETPEETESVLKVLDDLVDNDPEFGVAYNNPPRGSRYAYCHWQKPIDSSGKRPDWAIEPKILPIYQRRISEQNRICEGKITRGHRAFGYFPLDGHG